MLSTININHICANTNVKSLSIPSHSSIWPNPCTISLKILAKSVHSLPQDFGQIHALSPSRFWPNLYTLSLKILAKSVHSLHQDFGQICTLSPSRFWPNLYYLHPDFGQICTISIQILAKSVQSPSRFWPNLCTLEIIDGSQ